MPLVHVIPCASLSLASSVAGGSARYLHGRRLVGGYRHGARTSSWSWRRRDAVPAHAGMGAGSRGRRRERSRRSALAPSEANATGAVRVRVRPRGSGWGVSRTGAGEPRVMASGEAERRPVRGTGVVGSQHGWRCGARRLEREGIRAAEGRVLRWDGGWDAATCAPSVGRWLRAGSSGLGLLGIGEDRRSRLLVLPPSSHGRRRGRLGQDAAAGLWQGWTVTWPSARPSSAAKRGGRGRHEEVTAGGL
jgi:hypothetical protein